MAKTKVGARAKLMISKLEKRLKPSAGRRAPTGVDRQRILAQIAALRKEGKAAEDAGAAARKKAASERLTRESDSAHNRVPKGDFYGKSPLPGAGDVGPKALAARDKAQRDSLARASRGWGKRNRPKHPDQGEMGSHSLWTTSKNPGKRGSGSKEKYPSNLRTIEEKEDARENNKKRKSRRLNKRAKRRLLGRAKKDYSA